MNLRDEILREHSKSHTLYLTKIIGNSPSKFEELIDLFLNDEYRVTQRAAWVVTHCAEAYPSLINPHLPKIIENLRKPKLHDAVKRGTLKILADLNPKLSEEWQGHILDISFEFLVSQKEPVAIKVHSMQIVYNICQNEPELLNELKLVIEEQMPYSKPGFKSRGKRILKGIERLGKK